GSSADAGRGDTETGRMGDRGPDHRENETNETDDAGFPASPRPRVPASPPARVPASPRPHGDFWLREARGGLDELLATEAAEGKAVARQRLEVLRQAYLGLRDAGEDKPLAE